MEGVLYRHPAVRECAVEGVLDAVKGERAEAELLAYCGGHLAAYKVPRASEFVDQLPINAAAKILKRSLRGR